MFCTSATTTSLFIRVGRCRVVGGVGMEKVGGQLGEEALTNISLRGVGDATYYLWMWSCNSWRSLKISDNLNSRLAWEDHGQVCQTFAGCRFVTFGVQHLSFTCVVTDAPWRSPKSDFPRISLSLRQLTSMILWGNYQLDSFAYLLSKYLLWGVTCMYHMPLNFISPILNVFYLVVTWLCTEHREGEWLLEYSNFIIEMCFMASFL